MLMTPGRRELLRARRATDEAQGASEVTCALQKNVCSLGGDNGPAEGPAWAKAHMMSP
jgi:hypothetical protein